MKRFVDFIYLLLETIADVDLSPVMTPRCLYVFFSILYNSNSFFVRRNFTTTKDFPKHSLYFNKNILYDYVILEYAINDINLKLLNHKLDSFNFIEWFNLNTNSYNIFKQRNFRALNKIYDILNQYSEIRDNDGWKNANTPIELPNGNFHIKTEEIQNDIPINGKWCPLNINGINKNPLHPSINLISKVIDKDYYTEFETYYNNITQDEKNDEYKQVFQKSLTLTDEEKTIAEFWAGGPKTIKPPGFWNFFLYVYYYNIISSKDIFNISSKIVLNFFILNASLFQAGLCVWNAKYKIFEQRPIQFVRNMEEENITNFYFQDITTTKKWLPYQERNFVTPPFPDYVSGHSTFSSVGCEILNKVIGENLLDKNLKIEGSKLKILTPIFNNSYDETLQLTCINVYPKTSTVVNNKYPTKMVNLRFNTWTDMSIQAGISRIYGGIHISSSNYPGMIVGKMIVKDMLTNFNF
jgi:hypothetical protein